MPANKSPKAVELSSLLEVAAQRLILLPGDFTLLVALPELIDYL